MKCVLVLTVLLVSLKSSNLNHLRHGAQSPIPHLSRIHSHRETTPCQAELISGRYAAGIASEFPALSDGRPTILTHGESANIHCSCISQFRMVCTITCRSPEIRNIISARIGNSRTRRELLPFVRVAWPPLPFIGSLDLLEYVHPQSMNSIVIAEINIQLEGYFNFRSGTSDRQFASSVSSTRNPLMQGTYGTLPRWNRPLPLRSQSDPALSSELSDPALSSDSVSELSALLERQSSSPSRLHYANQMVPLRVCTGGSGDAVCPITLNPFEYGQVVYILKQERDKALRGESVSCISAEGMNKLKRESGSGQFRDPLRRTRDALLTIADDFEAYVISADHLENPSERELGTLWSTTDKKIILTIFYLICILFLILWWRFFTDGDHYRSHSLYQKI